MISRYLVIALAMVAAVIKAGQGAVVEAVGLSGLAAGLTALRLSATRPVLKPVAWFSFLVTAGAITVVVIRQLS
ncbi:MAG: hypothetical protein R2752_11600 [Vicinamibacterales bacterium]